MNPPGRHDLGQVNQPLPQHVSISVAKIQRFQPGEKAAEPPASHVRIIITPHACKRASGANARADKELVEKETEALPSEGTHRRKRGKTKAGCNTSAGSERWRQRKGGKSGKTSTKTRKEEEDGGMKMKEEMELMQMAQFGSSWFSIPGRLLFPNAPTPKFYLLSTRLGRNSRC